jgi:2,3-bisphosphoglycerate-independent phosphoglycerate mutase
LQHVLFVPDGAADRNRTAGCSPLGGARIPYCDFLAREGVVGRMQTLYPELPKESMVAQLGMLGWDPRRFYPHGRASCELLALGQPGLGRRDLAFRANLVTVAGGRLASYSAGLIASAAAAPLAELLRRELRPEFPDFELRHHADFRNTLVVRETGVEPRLMVCPEPHENQGAEVALDRLVSGRDGASSRLAARINRYLARAAELLAGRRANALWPWSPSRAFTLPSFAAATGCQGRVAIVGFMDFLAGIARAGAIEFVREGNGRPDTDYAAKGARVIELLEAGCELVFCHVNGPDEASHLGDRALKIASLEAFDRSTVGPVVEWFKRRPQRLGGVAVAPDHYTNHAPNGARAEAHSLDPVPFAIWNGRDRDAVTAFDEDRARHGRFGGAAIGHLELLGLLGVAHTGAAHAAATPAGAVDR